MSVMTTSDSHYSNLQDDDGKWDGMRPAKKAFFIIHTYIWMETSSSSSSKKNEEQEKNGKFIR